MFRGRVWGFSCQSYGTHFLRKTSVALGLCGAFSVTLIGSTKYYLGQSAGCWKNNTELRRATCGL